MITEDSYEWLGVPSPLEMWQQHCGLLTAEVDDLYRQLRTARTNIAKLVAMQVHAQTELAALRADYEKQRWELSDGNGRATEDYKQMMSMKMSINQLTDQLARYDIVGPHLPRYQFK